jgi:hypothetical protein
VPGDLPVPTGAPMNVLRWLAGLAFGVVALLWLKIGEWAERHNLVADDPDPEYSDFDRMDGLG